LARYGNPLEVTAQLSRAALCAKPGHVLICPDYGAVESRILAWLAGETWKLDAYRHYDATGDKSREPYRVIAGRMLNKDAGDIVRAERQQGKSAELACGFGGSVGAWRRIAGDDGRSDAEVLAIIKQWRDAHPAIREFWKTLARAARVAIRTGQPIQVGGGSRPAIITAFDGDALTLTVPSGRAINYPGARLVARWCRSCPPSEMAAWFPQTRFVPGRSGVCAIAISASSERLRAMSFVRPPAACRLSDFDHLGGVRYAPQSIPCWSV
jgi:DNA polymerase